MQDEENFRYAIPCSFDREKFLIYFNTQNKEDAIRLAGCIYGEKAQKLVIRVDSKGRTI